MVVGDNSGGTNVKVEAGEDGDVRSYEVDDNGDVSGSGGNEGRRNHGGGAHGGGND